jgi:serine/threonine protein kinase
MPKDSLGGRYEIVSLLGAGGPPAFAEAIGRELRRGSPEAEQEMIGSQLDRYSILAKLGEGGLGEVFLEEDTRLERRVAVKRLPASLEADLAE